MAAMAAFVLGIGNGCTNRGNKKSDSKDADSNKTTVEAFLATPEKWAGKEVIITGTVSHVCKHSGKKLFLFGEDPENTVKINTGAEYASFDIKLEGSDVEILGTVVEDEKIDENYLNKWESDIKKMVDDGEIKVCKAESNAITKQQGDTLNDNEGVEDPYADVKEMRNKLAKSGKTYISVYAIDCKTLKEIKK